MHSNTEKHDQLKLLLGLIRGRNLDTIISISFKGTIKICYISTVTDTLVKLDITRLQLTQAFTDIATLPNEFFLQVEIMTLLIKLFHHSPRLPDNF